MTAADFRKIALTLEGVEEYSRAGSPAFRAGQKICLHRFASGDLYRAVAESRMWSRVQQKRNGRSDDLS